MKVAKHIMRSHKILQEEYCDYVPNFEGAHQTTMDNSRHTQCERIPTDRASVSKDFHNVSPPCIPQERIFTMSIDTIDVSLEALADVSSKTHHSAFPSIPSGLTSDIDLEILPDIPIIVSQSTTPPKAMDIHASEQEISRSAVSPKIPLFQASGSSSPDLSKRPNFIPLGPRHLEYDYNLAFRNFKAILYMELGRQGYRGPNKKGRVGVTSCNFTAVDIELLRQRPAFQRAMKRLNDADKALDCALRRGETWGNTPVPAEFTWENKKLSEFGSLRGSMPMACDIGEARAALEMPKTRRRKPSAKVLEMADTTTAEGEPRRRPQTRSSTKNSKAAAIPKTPITPTGTTLSSKTNMENVAICFDDSLRKSSQKKRKVSALINPIKEGVDLKELEEKSPSDSTPAKKRRKISGRMITTSELDGSKISVVKSNRGLRRNTRRAEAGTRTADAAAVDTFS